MSNCLLVVLYMKQYNLIMNSEVSDISLSTVMQIS